MEARKVDPLLVALGLLASKEAMLEDITGKRSFALARILDKYELWHVKIRRPDGHEEEIPWGQELYMSLKAWEILNHGQKLGPDFGLGLALKPEPVRMSLDEALRRLGLL